MAKDVQKMKKSEVKINELGDILLNFAKETSSEKMELDIAKFLKEHSIYYRNTVLEAYAFGPEELKKYKIVEGKIAAPLKNVEPPCLSGKGTITIKKYYVDEFNKMNPSRQLVKDDSFDVAYEDGKIILSKK